MADMPLSPRPQPESSTSLSIENEFPTRDLPAVLLERAATNSYCQAGIMSQNLVLVTRRIALLPSVKHQLKHGSTCDTLIIVDLEESTACLHAYKKQGDGAFSLLKSIVRTNGAISYGARMKHWYIDILGRDVYDKMCKNKPQAILNFDRDLATRMKGTRSQATGHIALKIPVEFSEVYKKTTGRELRNMLPACATMRSEDKIRITFACFESFCEPYLESVFSIIEKFVQNNELQGQSIRAYITGSVAACDIVTKQVTDVISKNIPGTSITVADKPGLNTLEGGVMYGHHYQQPFDEVWKHTYCVVTGLLLKPLTKIGQRVPADPATIRIIVPIKPSQKKIEVHVIATDRNRPLLEDPNTDKHVGTIGVDVPLSAKSRKIDIEITLHVIGIEMIVTAKELVSKMTCKKTPYLLF